MCTRVLEAGVSAWWDGATRTVTCAACGERGVEQQDPPDLSAPIGQAGASAQRERERRVANDEKHTRSRHKHIGGLIWRLSQERTATKVWGTGAEGERIVGGYLDPLVTEGVVVLHDVRLPGERANVDHVVVGPSGVYVIDTKLYRERKIEVRNVGPIFSRTHHLFVGGRDRTTLVENMSKQVVKIDGLVRDLAAARIATVTPVLCFVYAKWGWPRVAFAVEGVRVMWPKALVKLLRREGPLGNDQITELGARLVTSLIHD